ncbi:MAG: hypothetical protein U9N50_09235 [Pseudomonadota bacterium]|nr:hypothetical protein [Pseudomonadota bacterium]
MSENPLQLAAEMFQQNRLEEARLLAQFSHHYLPVDPQYSSIAIDQEAENKLNSASYLIERFIDGALTGEPVDTPGLIGTVALDMMVIGDVRDLLVQGYKEFDTGQGDEVIMGLSAAGILLTLVPELSWGPSLFKTFWSGRRFSEPFQRQIKAALKQARKTGDYRSLQRIMGDFTEVFDSLGSGPAMAVFKRVNSTEDLARLAKKAKIAPMEAYTLTTIDGIKALENISSTSIKQGKLIKRVKFATRQQKLLGKMLDLIPVIWLLVIFSLSIVLSIALIAKGRKEKF